MEKLVEIPLVLQQTLILILHAHIPLRVQFQEMLYLAHSPPPIIAMAAGHGALRNKVMILY